MFDVTKIPFVQAKWYIHPTKNRHPQLIVIHSMEAPEKGVTAENVAKYFQTTKRPASTQYCVDNNSIVQCVQCSDICAGAPNANQKGIHIEHAGYARQTREQWLDEYSLDMLRLSAMLCRVILIPKFHIEARWLTVQEVARHKKDPKITGFCTHADVTAAFKQKGGHTDPGVNFPKDIYMRLVKGEII